MVGSISMPASMLKLVLILFFLLLTAATFGDTKPDPIVNQHAERKLIFEEVKASIVIDCGSADDNSIDTGVRGNISSEYFLKINKQGRTLRCFPNGTRNCYTLKPEGAKINQKYLVRANFVYGNYDYLNRVPRFDLHIGVNKWTTVNLSNSSSYIYYEIIYVSSTEYADVCLVNTGFGVPFISTLELKVLDDSVYEIEDGSSLLYSGRYDAGAFSSAEQPKDDYGRVWEPLPATNFDDEWLKCSTTDRIEPGSDGNPNDVPDEVWKTAARSENSSQPLNFKSTFNEDNIYQYHFYFYFAEIITNVSGRNMTISFNGNPPGTNIVTLQEPFTAVTVGPLTANATTTLSFSIASIEPSLKPIVNAFEIFKLNELPNRPTDIRDVDAMMEIKKNFNVTRNWQGDPCVPSDLSWQGVGCRYDNNIPPRIISLNLSSSNLSGELPDSLSKLTAIQSLDLSYNNLTGSVPSDLQKMFKDTPKLLRLDGNQICMSGACNKPKNHYILPLTAAVGTLIIILVIVLIVAMFFRRRRQKRGSLKSKDRLYSYSDIVSITRNFMTVIGEGGFGKVYHGILPDRTEVAVKMLSRSSKQGSKEFRAEAQLLTIVHHRNLVSLVGYCDENEHMGLIYEYMANGNLQGKLSGTNCEVLNWRERLQVAVSSAQGLEYLHNGCKPPIIHRDLKPTNILLDDKMQAKISDFGLSRAFSSETRSFMETNNPAGTPGYFDPEYQSSGNLSKKSDVYSFGVILLVLITGQPAIMRGSENNTHIVHRVKQILERGDIGAIVDPRLRGEFKGSAAWKVVEVAMSCVEPTAIQRPDMNHVLVELKEALELEMKAGRAWKDMRSTDYPMLEFSEDMTPRAR